MPDFSLSLISTVDLSTARTPSTEAHMALAWTAYPPHRLSEATTSSLVISFPLGNRLVVLVQRVEALVDVLGDDLHEVRRGPVGVERGRIPEHGDLQYPSLLGRLRPGLEPRHGHQADDQQQ